VLPSLCCGSSSTPPSSLPLLDGPPPLYLTVMDVISIIKTSIESPPRKLLYVWDSPSLPVLRFNVLLDEFFVSLLCLLSLFLDYLIFFSFAPRKILEDSLHRYYIPRKKLMMVISITKSSILLTLSICDGIGHLRDHL
jgi:hypothetical protein